MISSSKPRIQRLFRYTAPMHERQKFMHVHVDKALRLKLPMRQRAVQISRGDTVKVMSGSKRGTTGKVTKVNMRTGKIHIDSIKKKNSKGKEFMVPISSSNVYITDLNLTDKRRANKLKLKQATKPKEQPQQKSAVADATATAEKKAEAEQWEKKQIAIQNEVR